MDHRSRVLARCCLSLLPIATICALLSVSPHVALATSSIEGAAAIAFLNEQRQANGIPSITTDDQRFASAWCPDEDNGPSGGEAARILSGGAESWGPDVSPWDFAPLHQGVEYDPLLRTAGDVNVGDIACMGLGGEEPAPTTPASYVYLGDEGPRNVPREIDVAGEGPFAPQQLIGIPQGTPTGPQPIFYVYGIGVVHAGTWSLSTAAGAPVQGVKIVDSAAATTAGHPGYFPERGWMIPPPLKPGTAYNGQVKWVGEQGELTQTFAFTTAIATNLIGIGYHLGSRLVRAESQAPGGVLVFSRRGRTVRSPIASRGQALGFTENFPVSRLGSGRWRACVSSGGGTTGYQSKNECLPLTVRHGRVN
jgi:hypothetical protein